MGPDGKVAVPLVLTVPAGKGPFPVIVKGDLCWGRVKPEIVADVAKRGYMLAEFDRTAVAADNPDRSVGVYPHYGDTYDWRDMTAWAWGYHHVIDYLLTRDDVDAKKVIVTGHSRGGKAALLAGALDERVALTCPNGSGCGGAGCYRFAPADAEDIGRITKAFPFWFGPQFPQFVGHVDRLPFDQHSVKALVAPRALLSTEALGDRWANPEGTQVTYTAARVVYDFLGAGDRIGIHFREGKHEQNAEDFEALLDFADKVLLGKKVDRAFDKMAFPDAPRLFTWTATEPGQKPATTRPAAAAAK
jgi:pimeloyl-ACP methyl ester carboxylesterase